MDNSSKGTAVIGEQDEIFMLETSNKDAKTFCKPMKFYGEESKWIEWSFSLKAYVAMRNLMPERNLTCLAKQSTLIDATDIPREA